MKKDISLKNLTDDKKFELVILPLISSAAVLRKEKMLRNLLRAAKIKNISGIKVYESLLQTYLFAGFPNALISLQVASEYFLPLEKNQITEKSFREKGVLNCKKIYGNKFDKLIKNISVFSPELSDWLITEGYGKVFSRHNLSLKERELCNVSVLASLRYENQLYSHINGAFRLHNKLKEIELTLRYLQITGGITIQSFGLDIFAKFKKQKNPNL